MSVDLHTLEQQFKDRKYAELILHHVDNSGSKQLLLGMQGIIDELPDDFEEPTTQFLDFMAAMPSSQSVDFFSADCAEQLRDIIAVAKGFFTKEQAVKLSDE